MFVKTAAVAATLLFAASAAHANPLATLAAQEQFQEQTAVAGASAAAHSSSGAFSGSTSGASTGDTTSGSNGSVYNKSGDSRALGVALGQAATAAQGCLKGTKVGFGLVEWTDDSFKCENYRLAYIAAAAGEWKLANQWACRADGMTQAQCDAQE